MSLGEEFQLNVAYSTHRTWAGAAVSQKTADEGFSTNYQFQLSINACQVHPVCLLCHPARLSQGKRKRQLNSETQHAWPPTVRKTQSLSLHFLRAEQLGASCFEKQSWSHGTCWSCWKTGFKRWPFYKKSTLFWNIWQSIGVIRTQSILPQSILL